MSAARARIVMSPGPVRRTHSSHHCQLWRRRSPIRTAGRQGASPTRTSTRAMGAAPDQAKRKILGENLLRLHGLDLAEVKARLGRSS